MKRNKIIDGLKEAIAYANGDKSQGQEFTIMTPPNEAVDTGTEAVDVLINALDEMMTGWFDGDDQTFRDGQDPTAQEAIKVIRALAAERDAAVKERDRQHARAIAVDEFAAARGIQIIELLTQIAALQSANRERDLRLLNFAIKGRHDSVTP